MRRVLAAVATAFMTAAAGTAAIVVLASGAAAGALASHPDPTGDVNPGAADISSFDVSADGGTLSVSVTTTAALGPDQAVSAYFDTQEGGARGGYDYYVTSALPAGPDSCSLWKADADGGWSYVEPATCSHAGTTVVLGVAATSIGAGASVEVGTTTEHFEGIRIVFDD
ncbi:MAG: hypothetical protein QOD08_2371, partial [Gaiellaceae bacterium]|nr:hypothetical protein [Gaiellaceae bacterium]